MVPIVVCGECISEECSVTNRNLFLAFVMCVSEAFSMELLVNQGNLIDMPLSFSEIYISYKSCSGICFNEGKKTIIL